MKPRLKISHVASRACWLILTFVGWSASFHPAHAAEITSPEVSTEAVSEGRAPLMKSQWSSAAHLGWSTESASSTGFAGAGGSMVMFDVARQVTPVLALGFRSSGSGAVQDAKRLSRLGVGPLLEWRISPRWSVHSAVTRFHESVTHNNEGAWTSTGLGLSLGWTRMVPVIRGVDFSWGGFVGRHWGGVQPDRSSGGGAETLAHMATVRSNVGTTRGVEIALRTQL